MVDFSTVDSGSRDAIRDAILDELVNRKNKNGMAGVLADQFATLWAELLRLREAAEPMMHESAVIDALRAARDALDRPLADGHAQLLSLPDSVTIDATLAFDPSDGFHQLEWTNEGVGYRWSGPSTTSNLSCYIDRQRPLVLELSIVELAPGLRPEDVQCVVSGEQVILDWSTKEGALVGTVSLAARPSATKTVVEMNVPRTFLAQQVDNRRVGFAFRQLSIGPA